MRSTAREDRRRDRFTRFTLPVLRDIPWAALLAAGVLTKSGLREVLAEHARQHPEARDRLTRLAVQYARGRLERLGKRPPRRPIETLFAYRAAVGWQPRACPVCGTVALRARATYCGNACKQTAYRAVVLRAPPAPSTRRRMTRGAQLEEEVRQQELAIASRKHEAVARSSMGSLPRHKAVLSERQAL